MAAATVEDVTTTNFGSGATSHAVAMPATVAANDGLIAFFAPASTTTTTTPSGWTHVGTDISMGSSGSITTYVKVAAGDEDGTTVDFVTAATVEATAHVWRIRQATWGQTTASVETAGGSSSGVGGLADPPSLTASWGAVDNLFIALAHENISDEITGYPTSYADNQTHTTSGGAASAQLSSCSRSTTATATDNPSNFTPATTFAWCAQTVVVRPAGVAAPPGNGGGGGGGGGGRGGGGGGKGPGGGGPPGQGGGPPPGQGGGPRGGVVNPGSGIGGSINRRARSF